VIVSSFEPPLIVVPAKAVFTLAAFSVSLPVKAEASIKETPAEDVEATLSVPNAVLKDTAAA